MLTLTQWIEINLQNAKLAQEKAESSLIRPKGPMISYWEGYLNAVEALQSFLEERQDTEVTGTDFFGPVR